MTRLMNWTHKHRILIWLTIVELAIIDILALHIALIAFPTAALFVAMYFALQLIGSQRRCAWCYRPWAMWWRAGSRCCRTHRRILDRARRNLEYSRRDTRRTNGRSIRLQPTRGSIVDPVPSRPEAIRSLRPESSNDLPKVMIH